MTVKGIKPQKMIEMDAVWYNFTEQEVETGFKENIDMNRCGHEASAQWVLLYDVTHASVTDDFKS